jgi:hypothetical protein
MSGVLKLAATRTSATPVPHRSYHIVFRFEQLPARIGYEGVVVSNHDLRTIPRHL